jgi:hypothetical protein
MGEPTPILSVTMSVPIKLPWSEGLCPHIQTDRQHGPQPSAPRSHQLLGLSQRIIHLWKAEAGHSDEMAHHRHKLIPRNLRKTSLEIQLLQGTALQENYMIAIRQPTTQEHSTMPLVEECKPNYTAWDIMCGFIKGNQHKMATHQLHTLQTRA